MILGKNRRSGSYIKGCAKRTTEYTMTFRLQSKNLFLTYPNCNAEPNRLLEFARGVLSIKHYSIGRERHESGEFHLHGFFELTSKCDIRRADLLDFDGFHGDYKSARRPADAIKYTQKEGDYITDIIPFEQRVLAAPTERAFLDLLISEGKIHQYKFWREYRTSPQEDSPVAFGDERPWWTTVRDFISGGQRGRPKAAYLCGPPQTGKTAFVLRYWPLCFMASQPREFSIWSKENVFFLDDFDYDVWKRDLSFLYSLITLPRSVKTPAYYGIKSIPWPRTVIIASNTEPGLFWEEGLKDRIKVFHTT